MLEITSCLDVLIPSIIFKGNFHMSRMLTSHLLAVMSFLALNSCLGDSGHKKSDVLNRQGLQGFWITDRPVGGLETGAHGEQHAVIFSFSDHLVDRLSLQLNGSPCQNSQTFQLTSEAIVIEGEDASQCQRLNLVVTFFDGQRKVIEAFDTESDQMVKLTYLEETQLRGQIESMELSNEELPSLFKEEDQRVEGATTTEPEPVAEKGDEDDEDDKADEREAVVKSADPTQGDHDIESILKARTLGKLVKLGSDRDGNGTIDETEDDFDDAITIVFHKSFSLSEEEALFDYVEPVDGANYYKVQFYILSNQFMAILDERAKLNWKSACSLTIKSSTPFERDAQGRLILVKKLQVFEGIKYRDLITDDKARQFPRRDGSYAVTFDQVAFTSPNLEMTCSEKDLSKTITSEVLFDRFKGILGLYKRRA